MVELRELVTHTTHLRATRIQNLTLPVVFPLWLVSWAPQTAKDKLHGRVHFAAASCASCTATEAAMDLKLTASASIRLFR